MSRRVFFDTNVLVYRFDRDEPEKQAKAAELLREEALSGSLVLSTQVLQEFFVTVTRKLKRPLAVDEALSAIREFRSFSIVQVDVNLIEAAIVLSKEKQLSFWDSLILESAVRTDCTTLLTEDLQHGFELKGLRVVNPFGDS